ncbi:MAG TPA: hypothetical protein VFV52_16980, partial [Bacilli bacterium]|nr:hypothetical protein [Bacilli bacterium]
MEPSAKREPADKRVDAWVKEQVDEQVSGERRTLRVLIMSDSHGREDRIANVIEQVGDYDLLLHA